MILEDKYLKSPLLLIRASGPVLKANLIRSTDVVRKRKPLLALCPVPSERHPTPLAWLVARPDRNLAILRLATAGDCKLLPFGTCDRASAWGTRALRDGPARKKVPRGMGPANGRVIPSHGCVGTAWMKGALQDKMRQSSDINEGRAQAQTSPQCLPTFTFELFLTQ
jgi:hypothetical protein